jgi:hypothetical protein
MMAVGVARPAVVMMFVLWIPYLIGIFLPKVPTKGLPRPSYRGAPLVRCRGIDPPRVREEELRLGTRLQPRRPCPDPSVNAGIGARKAASRS